MENRKFDQMVKKKVANFEANPPASTFSKIQEQLAQTTDKKGAFVLPIPWLKYGVAASVAFLMGMGVMSWLMGHQENEKLSYLYTEPVQVVEENTTKQVVEENEQEQIKILKENKLDENKNKEGVNPMDKSSNKKEEKSNLQEYFQNTNPNKIVIDLDGKYASNHETNKNSLATINTYALYNFSENIPEALEIVKVEDEPSFLRFMDTQPKSYNLGVWAGPKISFESRFFGGQSFLGNGFGIDLGYNFKGKLGLQTGFSYSMMNKEFKVLDEDGNASFYLYDLSAINLPLSLKIRKSYFARSIERPVSFNAYLGLDYSRLQGLSKNQIGAHLGFEYDLFLRPELMFTLGLRAGVNQIMNYSSSESFLAQNAGKKLNYTLGIYTAIRLSQNKQ